MMQVMLARHICKTETVQVRAQAAHMPCYGSGGADVFKLIEALHGLRESAGRDISDRVP